MSSRCSCSGPCGAGARQSGGEGEGAARGGVGAKRRPPKPKPKRPSCHDHIFKDRYDPSIAICVPNRKAVKTVLELLEKRPSAEDVIDLGAPRELLERGAAGGRGRRRAPGPRLYPGPPARPPAPKRRRKRSSRGGPPPVPNARLYRPGGARPAGPPQPGGWRAPPPGPLPTASRAALALAARPHPQLVRLSTLVAASSTDAQGRPPPFRPAPRGFAPPLLLSRFLAAVLSRRYVTALRLCRRVLELEPAHPTARQFYPLLRRKLAAPPPAAASEPADSRSSHSGASSSLVSLNGSEDSVPGEQGGSQSQSLASLRGQFTQSLPPADAARAH